MSIVTDALNRLQSARARGVRPTAAHDPDLSNVDTPEAQDDEKNPTVDKTFVSVSVGGFLLAAVVAMGAYWWGEYPVSDIPKMPSSVSARTDPSFDHSIDESLDSVSSEQEMPVSDEDLVELLPGELPPLSPSPDDQEHIEITEAQDDSEGEVTVSFSPQAMAESESNHESRLQDVARLPIEHDPVTASDSDEQEVFDDSTNRSSQTLNAAKSESKAKAKSRSMDSDVSSKLHPTLSENTKAILESHTTSEATTQPSAQPRADESTFPISSVDESSSVSLVKADSIQRVRDSAISQEPILSEMAMRSDEETVTRLSPEQRMLKARLLIEQQSYSEAIAVLQPLFAMPPSSWEPWFWMGTAHFGLGELEKAEDAFMEGLVRDETVPYLWVQRAVIEQQRGQYGKAMDALRQAELLDPKLPEVQLNLAYNLEHQGQVNLARRHYRQYLALTEGKSAYHAVRRKVLERILRM